MEEHEKLERTKAELDELAYVVSHDLRAPLRTILHNLQFLQRRCGDQLDTENANHLERALEATEKSHHMLDDLLVYSRLKTRARPHELVDCGELVGRALRELSELLARSGGEVTCGELPQVLADRQQLQLLFKHLIQNGLRYGGGERPQITISCERRGDNFRIAVQDNGPGFPGNDPERAIRMFASLHDPEERQGTGMGLPICRSIAEVHGGSLAIANLEEGGACVCVTLPVPTDEALTKAEPPRVRIIQSSRDSSS